jgi:hypothetical protein
MGCNCGGGKVRFDNQPRPTVRAQPSYGIRINTGASSPGGAQPSNPNKPITQAQPATPRTQV